jgi:uncharacterized membrane protein (DUF485 family)
VTHTAPPILPPTQRFELQGLGRIVIDATNPDRPRLKAWLDPKYGGEIEFEASAPSEDGYRLYLDCDSANCVSNTDTRRKLDKLAEVLYQHDHDRDGTYDADDVLSAIELAMWQSSEAPVVFERPKGGIYTGLLMKLLSMAPAPKRHIAYSFGELRKRFRGTDYLWALPMLLGFIGLVQLQIHYVPWLKYSVITGYFEIGKRLGLSEITVVCSFVVLLVLLMKRGKRRPGRTETPHTYGLFNKAALYEEQVWREGSHRWNFGQRLISCLTFGAIHMVNLFYPLATILPLTIAGGVFMYIYLKAYRRYIEKGRVHARRDATFRAAIAHRLYNRCALAAVVFVVVLLVVQGSLSLLGIIALVGSVLAVSWRDRFGPEH